jgi:16S rRNA C967 or C1407 C5-methylase (RsmB/RsmF family)
MAKSGKNRIGFDEYYLDSLGDRWTELKSALLIEKTHCTLGRPLLKDYLLDPASKIAAEALDVQPGQRVLDLCAAPGGKSLILAMALSGTGSLTCNEKSSDRLFRLKRIIGEHLPKELSSIIRITGHDASRWGLYEKEIYDRVLADVPCSSEAHVLSSPKHLAIWSENRTKTLSIQALAILLAGFAALKKGGKMVYSTCALSPLENDGVIERFSRKKEGEFFLDQENRPGTEKTRFGFQIWPDRFPGQGPIYFCVIEKAGRQE